MFHRVIPLLAISVAVLTDPATSPALEPVSPTQPTFEGQIRPLLKAYCTECHGESEKPKGELDLRLRRFMIQGGRSGPAIHPGKPEESELYLRVRDGEMPPGKTKLKPEEQELLRRWIAAGAKTEKPEPESLARGFIISDDDRQWWAFQPIRRPPVPASQQSDRVRTPIDALLLPQLREAKLGFSPDADRVTLIRRVTFDLTGLPPTPEEVATFVADTSADAYDKLIDRLLASPQYGERWGRHWLDVAGYADSEGFDQSDPIRATAWKYRDYVIRSLNADKPFDQFVREQLAGDELVKWPYAELPPDQLDALIATGFLRMSPDGSGNPGVDQKEARNAVVADTVKVIGSALLGLTLGCAQCHNHRYDPIPQADFYRIRATLEPAFHPGKWQTPASRQVSLYTAAQRAEAAKLEAEAKVVDARRLKAQQEFIDATLEKEFAQLPEAIQKQARAAKATPAAKLTAEQKSLLQKYPSLNVNPGSLYLYDRKAADQLKTMADEAAAIRARKPKEEFIRALTEEPGPAPETRLFHRGDPDQAKEVIAPGALQVIADRLPYTLPTSKDSPSSGRRLALAQWITHPDQPLFARVIVNRIWLNHFGRGIVGTPGDFGRLGERPTHPELLDWLAAEFQQSGYRLKHLHKRILTSTVYRQSSARSEAGDRQDPDNRLYGRFPLRRLDAEAIRDGMLAVSGTLNPAQFGPPVPVMPDDVGQIILGMANRDGAGYKKGDETLTPEQLGRRSIYVQVRRSQRLAFLDTFDWATVEPNCEVRISSTVTPQALMLMNNDFIIGQAGHLTKRLLREAGPDPRKQIRLAWQLAYSHEPTSDDLDRAEEFLQQQEAYFRDQPESSETTGNAPAPSKVKKAQPVKTNPPPSPAERALQSFCQAILMSNRFLYVD